MHFSGGQKLHIIIPVNIFLPFSAMKLSVGRPEGHPTRINPYTQKIPQGNYGKK